MRLTQLKVNLRKDFNVSIAELGDRNKWQSVLLGILLLGRKTTYINEAFDRILKYIKKFHKLQIIDYDIKLM